MTLRTLLLCGLLLCGLLVLAGCEQKDTPSTRADAVTAKPAATASPSAVASGRPSARPATAKHASAKASAAVASAAVATASASATSSAIAAAEPVTTLAAIAKAGKLKLRRLGPTTGGSEASATVDDPEKVRALLAAIGIVQAAVDACPRCIPSVQITFEDAFGTRLGSLGLFCSDQPDKPAMAALRDALANTCETLTIAAPEALRKLIDDALGPPAAAKE